MQRVSQTIMFTACKQTLIQSSCLCTLGTRAISWSHLVAWFALVMGVLAGVGPANFRRLKACWLPAAMAAVAL